MLIQLSSRLAVWYVHWNKSLLICAESGVGLTHPDNISAAAQHPISAC